MKLLILVALCISAVAAVPLNRTFGLHRAGPGRIINGSPASPGQFPHQVAVVFKTSYGDNFCGGAIISPDYILTAAHCVLEATDAAAFSIYPGIINLDDLDTPYSVSEYVVHRGYSSWNLENDIGVLKLTEPLVFSETVQPIALGEELLEDGSLVTVSGWGIISDDATDLSPVLNYVELTTISASECDEYYGSGTTYDGVVCAAAGDPVKSTCGGDSGGPLIVSSSGTPTHVGIVSFGSTLGCESGYPSGYTRTAFYRQWIRENTGV